LDVPFTEAELEKCLKALKKNKSVGTDTIMNEYILTGKTTLIPVWNPNCTSVKMSFSSLHFTNRELINEVKSFPTWESNEIPR
jgi:hypothetical protein